MPRYIDADILKPDYIVGSTSTNTECYKYVSLKQIVSAPTANVIEQKSGKWINNKGLYMCSCCKHLWSELWWIENCPMERMYKIMRFCPNCGAKMEVDNDSLH